MKIAGGWKMKNTQHGSGSRGMAFYKHEDNAGLGFRMEARRESYRHPFVETWRHVALPNQAFPTYRALKEALEPVTDEQVAEEAAKWPVLHDVHPDTCGNACRLCPRPKLQFEGRQHFDTMRVSIATSWCDQHGWFASLCNDHFEQFNGKPVELVAALQAEVDERRKRFTSKLTDPARLQHGSEKK